MSQTNNGQTAMSLPTAGTTTTTTTTTAAAHPLLLTQSGDSIDARSLFDV